MNLRRLTPDHFLHESDIGISSNFFFSVGGLHRGGVSILAPPMPVNSARRPVSPNPDRWGCGCYTRHDCQTLRMPDEPARDVVFARSRTMPDPLKTQGAHHIGLTVTDVEKARDFFVGRARVQSGRRAAALSCDLRVRRHDHAHPVASGGSRNCRSVRPQEHHRSAPFRAQGRRRHPRLLLRRDSRRPMVSASSSPRSWWETARRGT